MFEIILYKNILLTNLYAYNKHVHRCDVHKCNATCELCSKTFFFFDKFKQHTCFGCRKSHTHIGIEVR